MPTSTVGSGKTYSTLQAWANARVNSGTPETASCFAGSDLGALSMSGGFTEIHIVAAPGNRHNGTDAGHTGVAYSTGLLDIEDIIDIEINGLRLEGRVSVFTDFDVVTLTVCNNLVLHDTTGPDGGLISALGSEGDGPPSFAVDIFNNLIFDRDASAVVSGIMVEISTANGDGTVTGNIYNNTISSNSYCVNAVPDNGETILLDLRNNILIAFAPATALNDNGLLYYTGTSDYNLTNKVDSTPGTHTLRGVAPNSIFQSNTNYNLKSTSVAKNAAQTLGAAYATDAIGTARPQGPAWDIGAMELIVAVSGRLRRAFPFRFFRH